MQLEKIDYPWAGHHFDMNVLVALDDAGGHCEALSTAHRQALSVLTDERLVRRVTYPAGLVIYEITDAGRRLSAAGLPGEMENAQMPSPDEETERADRELMQRYGIVQAPADYFLYRGYRYSSLKDAVAQAERNRAVPPKSTAAG